MELGVEVTENGRTKVVGVFTCVTKTRRDKSYPEVLTRTMFHSMSYKKGTSFDGSSKSRASSFSILGKVPDISRRVGRRGLWETGVEDTERRVRGESRRDHRSKTEMDGPYKNEKSTNEFSTRSLRKGPAERW